LTQIKVNSLKSCIMTAEARNFPVKTNGEGRQAEMQERRPDEKT
jgi:hypothetical protein